MTKNMAVLNDDNLVTNIVICRDNEPETPTLIEYSDEKPAGIGYVYDEEGDAFIPPQPFESWVLDEDTCLWVAPVPMPEPSVNEHGFPLYVWDEEAGNWSEVTGE